VDEEWDNNFGGDAGELDKKKLKQVYPSREKKGKKGKMAHNPKKQFPSF